MPTCTCNYPTPFHSPTCIFFLLPLQVIDFLSSQIKQKPCHTILSHTCLDPSCPNDPLNMITAYASAGWISFAKGVEELLLSLQAFIDFSQVSLKVLIPL